MKKLLSILFLSLLMLNVFACGTSNVSNETTTNDATNEVVEEQLPPLELYTNAEFPPYEYKDGGEFLGIDIELAKEIGNILGREVNITDIAFDSLIPALVSGKADFVMAGMTVNEERKMNVDFSDTYQNAVQSVIVLSESEIKTIDDLNGKMIGVQTGTTGDLYATDGFGDENITRYSKIVDGIQALKVNKIDAVMIDDQVAKTLVENEEGLVILDTPYAEEEYAIAVKKGNTELLNQINSAISELKSNGKFDEIINKYIK